MNTGTNVRLLSPDNLWPKLLPHPCRNLVGTVVFTHPEVGILGVKWPLAWETVRPSDGKRVLYTGKILSHYASELVEEAMDFSLPEEEVGSGVLTGEGLLT